MSATADDFSFIRIDKDKNKIKFATNNVLPTLKPDLHNIVLIHIYIRDDLFITDYDNDVYHVCIRVVTKRLGYITCNDDYAHAFQSHSISQAINFVNYCAEILRDFFGNSFVLDDHKQWTDSMVCFLGHNSTEIPRYLMLKDENNLVIVSRVVSREPKGLKYVRTEIAVNNYDADENAIIIFRLHIKGLWPNKPHKIKLSGDNAILSKTQQMLSSPYIYKYFIL